VENSKNNNWSKHMIINSIKIGFLFSLMLLVFACNKSENGKTSEGTVARRKERYRIPERVDRVQGYLSAFLSKK